MVWCRQNCDDDSVGPWDLEWLGVVMNGDDDSVGPWDVEWLGDMRKVMMTVWAPGNWSGLVSSEQ